MPLDRPVSRRNFLRTAVATGASLTLLGATAKGAGKSFKLGLIGCGGRGRGAADNCIAAGQALGLGVEVAALADYFPDRLAEANEKFKIPADRSFLGADGYKKLLGTNVDIVILATPPVFRPLHLEAAVDAGKHVFAEKPVGVDPVGCRRVIAAGEKAKAKNLAIVAGTQRRHSRAYRVAQWLVAQGAVGKIATGCVYWCGDLLSLYERKPGDTDPVYMLRNWYNFVEMSGDLIVEQHVHNIDIANWFIGSPPVVACGFGGRARRKTGDQFDFFSVDYEYPGGVHVHSMSRQINGCWNCLDEYFMATGGQIRPRGGLRGLKPTAGPIDIKPPEFAEHRGGPYVQEHIALLDSIVKSQPLNEAKDVAESTLTGVMGRLTAYTGARIEWKQLMDPASDLGKLQLKPTAEDFEAGNIKAPQDDVVPIPGRA